MSTVNLNGQGPWRWCDDTYAVAAADNTAITNHSASDYMILCLNVFYLDPCNKATNSCQLKLQYSKDGGAWTDVSSTAEVRPVLVPAAGFSQGGNCTVKIAAAPAFCTTGFVTKPTQCENTNLTSSFANASQTFTEFQIALSFVYATSASVYTFRAYNVTTGTALTQATGATTPSLTMEDTTIALTIADISQAQTIDAAKIGRASCRERVSDYV